MKANITRYIGEGFGEHGAVPVRRIAIRLNGFVCHIFYGVDPGGMPAVWTGATTSRRVLAWSGERHDETLTIADVARFEALLAPLLSRVLDGHSLIWTGQQHEGRLAADAEAASTEIAALLAQPMVAAPDAPAQQPNFLVADNDWRSRLRRRVQSANTLPVSAGPLVSIIIGVHNKAAFVAECLTSVLTQGVENLEIVCIDDASTDASASVVEEFAAREPRLRFFRNSRNEGAGPVRNRALELACGQYIVFLDADDLLAPGGLPRLLDLIMRDGADMARGGIAFHYPGKAIALRPADLPPDRASFEFSAEPHLWIPWWFTAFIYSRAFLRDNNLEFPPLSDGEDPVFLAAALTRASRISSLSDIVYYYRRHRGQKRNDGDYLAHLEAVGRIFAAHDPRTWRDGYAQHVAAHDIPARLAKRPEMAEDPRYHVVMAAIAGPSGRI